jgi:two-component system, OmpR family, response regulator
MQKPLQCLLVEDQQRVVRFITQGLEEKGHTVTSVGRGEDALVLAASKTFTVVILDVGLAGELSGFEVASQLRALHPRIPILMLTARHGTEDIVRGLELGADDYMTKPFGFVEFEARLRALARRTHSSRVGALRVGRVEIDPLHKSALSDGGPLQLTPIEFEILWDLGERAGHSVSRSDLRERVWGLAFDPGTRVIDVHVSNLRKKLAGSESRIQIVTERGVGFKLIEVA